ncbi:hypothetical protein BVZ69_01220B, partial [Haemophilus influenzae]|jgi:hypothetical protein
LKIK